MKKCNFSQGRALMVVVIFSVIVFSIYHFTNAQTGSVPLSSITSSHTSMVLFQSGDFAIFTLATQSTPGSFLYIDPHGHAVYATSPYICSKQTYMCTPYVGPTGCPSGSFCIPTGSATTGGTSVGSGHTTTGSGYTLTTIITPSTGSGSTGTSNNSSSKHIVISNPDANTAIPYGTTMIPFTWAANYKVINPGYGVWNKSNPNDVREPVLYIELFDKTDPLNAIFGAYGAEDTIVSSSTGGTYHMYLSKYFPPGQYKIRLTDFQSPYVHGIGYPRAESPYFTVSNTSASGQPYVKPALTITSPSSGTSFPSGTTNIPVTWSSNYVPNQVNFTLVKNDIYGIAGNGTAITGPSAVGGTKTVYTHTATGGTVDFAPMTPIYPLTQPNPIPAGQYKIWINDTSGDINYYTAYFTVRASSNQTGVTNTTPTTVTVPSVPTNLAASLTSPTQARLSWTVSTRGTNPISGYKIWNGDSLLGTSQTNSYSMTVTPGSTYNFRVSAYDNANVPNASQKSSLVTFNVPQTVVTTVAPSITVTSPNGGSFDTNSTLSVSFSTTGLSGKVANVFLVNTDTNKSYQLATSISLTDSTVSFSTPVPYYVLADNQSVSPLNSTYNGGHYKLRVEAFDYSGNTLATGMSGNTITITKASSVAPPISTVTLEVNKAVGATHVKSITLGDDEDAYFFWKVSSPTGCKFTVTSNYADNVTRIQRDVIDYYKLNTDTITSFPTWTTEGRISTTATVWPGTSATITLTCPYGHDSVTITRTMIGAMNNPTETNMSANVLGAIWSNITSCYNNKNSCYGF